MSTTTNRVARWASARTMTAAAAAVLFLVLLSNVALGSAARTAPLKSSGPKTTTSMQTATTSNGKFLLTYADSCETDVDDVQVIHNMGTVAALQSASKGSSSSGGGDVEVGLFNTSNDSSPTLAAFSSEEQAQIEKEIDEAYHRLKANRYLYSLKFAQRDQPILKKSATSTTTATTTTTTTTAGESTTLPWATTEEAIAAANAQPKARRLSEEVDRESVRDHLLALLEVGSTRFRAFSSESAAADAGSTLDATYLSSVGVDIIARDDESSSLYTLATALPCMAGAPDKDMAFQSHEVLPNDLWVGGTSTLGQYALLHPNSSPRNEPYGMRVTLGWDSYTMSGLSYEPIVIAVVDSGCSMNPDLEANLCKSTDTCAGYDFGDDDDNPFDEPFDYMHGTAVSSVIAGYPNNGFGVAGTCWGCRIMCLKAYNSSQKAMMLSSFISAYDFILKKGVALSNHSYGGYAEDSVPTSMQRAIDALETAGHLMVVSSGNDACNLENGCTIDGKTYKLVIPAGATNSNLLVVGSSTHEGTLSSFSNYGTTTVDVLAPGSDIIVVQNSVTFNRAKGLPDSTFSEPVSYMDGTSFSAPYVTGVAALVWGRNPNMAYSAVKSIIMNNVAKQSALSYTSVTGGIVDALPSMTSSEITNPRTEAGWGEVAAPTVDRTLDYYSNGAGGFVQIGVFGLVVSLVSCLALL